jgi:hypothetical protein
MADTKISALTAVVTPATTDELAINQSAVSKRMTLAQLETHLQSRGMPRVKSCSSQHSVSSTTPTEVTDLSMTVEAGTYVFDYSLILQSATVTVGPQFNWNFTGTTTKSNWWFEYADLSSTLLAAIGTMAHDTSTSTLGFLMAKAEDDEATSATGNMGPIATTNSVQTINTNILAKIRGLLVCSTSGDIALWHGSETATATSVEVGSSLVVVRTA